MKQVRILLMALIVSSLSTIFFHSPVSAVTAAGFNPGKIIDDSVFIDYNSMSVQDIQNFLNSKLTSCDTWGTQPYAGTTRAAYAASKGVATPFICLKDYSENSVSSAQIIYNAAQSYHISPKTLIVLLQKEQGLVNDDWPWPVQYRSATGYGCPDTAVCDAQYYGLTNQVNNAARMFRKIMDDDPNWYTPYLLGNNTIQWHPDFWNTTTSQWEDRCGGTTVFIQNRATQALYNYTPYQPNQASIDAGYGQGDSCSSYGNRNFYLYFRDWFGYNGGPVAFKTADSPIVYVPMQDYKITIPSMALLQDYGVAANAIQVVSQSYIDSRPTPPGASGVSQSLSYVIKSPNDADEDGGCLYLISRGKRYQFQTMQQLADFGFSVSDISYIPLSNIFSIPNGGLLQNFVTTPNSSEVFKVNAGNKGIYLQFSAYIAQNPSGQTTPLSHYLLDRLTSGQPITSGTVLIKYGDSAAIYVYENGHYYVAPDYATFSECWRLDRELSTPLYIPSQNNYVAPIVSTQALDCIVGDGTTNYLLNGGQKSSIPSSYGITGSVMTSDLASLAARLPDAARPLSQYIKNAFDPSVWIIESGKKRLIPSYSNFHLLGARDSDIDIISIKATNSLMTGQMKLANGQLVKTASSPSVDVISGNERVSYPSSELFNAYKNSWSSIETYADTTLNGAYPNNGNVVSSYLVDSTQSKAYIVGMNGCYVLSQTTLDALGKSYPELSTAQNYSSAIFPTLNLGTCKTSSLFIKNRDSPVVYWLDSGKKNPLNSYSAMTSKNNGQTPTIMETTNSLLLSIPTGNTIL